MLTLLELSVGIQLIIKLHISAVGVVVTDSSPTVIMIILAEHANRALLVDSRLSGVRLNIAGWTGLDCCRVDRREAWCLNSILPVQPSFTKSSRAEGREDRSRF